MRNEDFMKEPLSRSAIERFSETCEKLVRAHELWTMVLKHFPESSTRFSRADFTLLGTPRSYLAVRRIGTNATDIA